MKLYFSMYIVDPQLYLKKILLWFTLQLNNFFFLTFADSSKLYPYYFTGLKKTIRGKIHTQKPIKVRSLISNLNKKYWRLHQIWWYWSCIYLVSDGSQNIHYFGIFLVFSSKQKAAESNLLHSSVNMTVYSESHQEVALVSIWTRTFCTETFKAFLWHIKTFSM